MQNKSERDREEVYRLVGEHSREDADGVPQVVHIGVVNPQNPRVETAQEICDELLAAATHIPKERLGATDDCGFSPFSIDEKPLHGSPDFARDGCLREDREPRSGRQRNLASTFRLPSS